MEDLVFLHNGNFHRFYIKLSTIAPLIIYPIIFKKFQLGDKIYLDENIM